MATMKSYGLWTLVFLVVANMIGAGVFTTSGFTLASVYYPWLVVAAWIVAGIIAIAGAHSYGSLTRLFPESGGEYLFLSRALHPLIGFIAGWVSIVAGFTGAIAFAATTFETYIRSGGGTFVEKIPQDTIAIAVILLGGMIHWLRVGFGASFQNITVVLKLFLLAAAVVACFWFRPPENWFGGPAPDLPTGIWPLILGFAGSLVWISLSYSGFNAAVYVAGEAPNASVIVPRAMLIGTLLTTVLYVLINTIFVYSAPAEKIAGVPDVAFVSATVLGGDTFARFVQLIIVLALFSSISSMLMAAPRVYAKMADDGMLPRFIRFESGAESGGIESKDDQTTSEEVDTGEDSFRGPRAAIVMQTVLAIGLVLLSTLQGLLNYLSLTLSLSAACAVCCLLLPRYRAGSWLSLRNLAPIFFVAATVINATLLTIGNPRQILGTLITVVLGTVIYFLMGGNRRYRVAEKNGASKKTAQTE